jgi:UDP-GlcNAc:undecaprenyl-phosphate/decaprenyl-phosphate GlcNAc-1-phosphate transferase
VSLSQATVVLSLGASQKLAFTHLWNLENPMQPLIMYSLLVCFAASCAISMILTRCVRDAAVARGLATPPELDRHIHGRAIPRLGGVAVYLSVMSVLVLSVAASKRLGVAQVFSLRHMVGLLGPAAIVFLLGVYDDLRGANAYLKFGVQAMAAGLLYFAGYGVEHFDLFSRMHALGMALGLPITVFWVLLVTNAFNLIDGLDGLAAGSAFFSTTVIFMISLLRGNLTVSFMTITLAGAMLGFLRYNFNPATIFLGDSGSLFVGFLLSELALAGSQKATTIVAVTIPVIAFGLPILDVTLAVARRFLGGKPLFTGDNDHIHHRLLKRGFSQRGAVLTLYGVTAAFALLSLALLHGEKLLAAVLIVIAISVFWGICVLQYVELSELKELMRRAAMRRRIVANNVSIRRAAEALGTCQDREGLCRILQATFEPLGFDGFRLENFAGMGMPETSVSPLHCDLKGRLAYSWSGVGGREPVWELRLQLPTMVPRPLIYLCLFQMNEDKPVLFDLGVLTNGVRASISDAVQRTMLRDETDRERVRAAATD